MDKYIDFYGFGIKSSDFHNAWGDSRILILRKSGKYSLGKSNTLGGTTHYVRFLTRSAAQNFIDNYIPTDPDLKNGTYSIYTVKYNRPAVLWDSKYNVYATTYALPKGVQPAQYDKTNTSVMPSISADDITIEYMNQLMDHHCRFSTRACDTKLIIDDYLKWLGIPVKKEFVDDLLFRQTFKRTAYRRMPGKNCLEVSGEMKWQIKWWFGLRSLTDWHDFLDYLFSANRDLYDNIHRQKEYTGNCTFQLDLKKFKDFIKYYGYSDFNFALQAFIEHTLVNLLFYKPLYADTKDSFEALKQNILKTFGVIKKEWDEFIASDVLESIGADRYDIKIGQQFKKEPIEGSGSVYTASLIVTQHVDPESDESSNKHKILMSFGFNEGKKALQFVDWPAFDEDTHICNLITEFYEQLHLKQLSSNRWLSPINNIDEDPALLEEIVLDIKEALQEWFDNN